MVSGSCMPLFASARVKEARPLSVMRTSVSSSTASAIVSMIGNCRINLKSESNEINLYIRIF